MAASTVISTFRRAEPKVHGCFRNAFLHRPDPSHAAALSLTPQLAVVFTWIGAKERSAHKFVDAWTRRGFYVLHVTTPILDLMMPKRGTEVTAARVMDFLAERNDFKIILHGLSVGGYLGQRVLMGLQGTDILPRITHQIYDSFTQVAGFHSGVEHAVNPRYKNLAKAGVRLYTKFADLECLQEASDFIYRVPTHSPAFFMHSLADKVADYGYIRDMLPAMARGSPVSTLLLPKSRNIGHVSLFRNMGEQTYMSCIIRFLKKNKFGAIKDEILDEEDPKCKESQENIKITKDVEALKS